jgi:hypothetical protein
MPAARRRAAAPRSSGERRTRPNSIHEQARGERTSHCPRHRRAFPFPPSRPSPTDPPALFSFRERVTGHGGGAARRYDTRARRWRRRLQTPPPPRDIATAAPAERRSRERQARGPASCVAVERAQATTKQPGLPAVENRITFMGTNNEPHPTYSFALRALPRPLVHQQGPHARQCLPPSPLRSR